MVPISDNSHIVKARNWPTRVLRTIRSGDEPYLHDLHGYSCRQASELMRDAFAEALPLRVTYVFEIGSGLHSDQKYCLQLDKACREGLQQAGLKENRHAASDAVGCFKTIIDKGQGVHLIRVYPKLEPDAKPDAEEVSTVAEDDADTAAMAAACAERAIAQAIEHCAWDPPQLTVLGLVKLLSSCGAVLLVGIAGQKRLQAGQMPSTEFEKQAAEVVDQVKSKCQEAYFLLRSALRVDGLGLTQDEKSACRSTLEELLKSSLMSKQTSELHELLRVVDGCGDRQVCKQHRALEDAVQLKAREHAKQQDMLACWRRKPSAHQFPNDQAARDAVRKEQGLAAELKALEEKLCRAQIWKVPEPASEMPPVAVEVAQPWEFVEAAPSATATEPHAAAATTARLELGKEVFRVLDTNGDGRLSRMEYYPVAKRIGFDGGLDEWEEEYAQMCADWSSDPRRGIDCDLFLKLIEDLTDKGCYCTDDDLHQMLKDVADAPPGPQGSSPTGKSIARGKVAREQAKKERNEREKAAMREKAAAENRRNSLRMEAEKAELERAQLAAAEKVAAEQREAERIATKRKADAEQAAAKRVAEKAAAEEEKKTAAIAEKAAAGDCSCGENRSKPQQKSCQESGNGGETACGGAGRPPNEYGDLPGGYAY